MISTTNNENVITLEESETQESLVAGGFGVKSSSNIVGLLLLLPINRDNLDDGVSSQAPDFGKYASAETVVLPGTQQKPVVIDSTKDENSKLQLKVLQSSIYKRPTNIIKAMTILKNKIKQQNKLINTLMSSINELKVARKKTKSMHVQESIDKVTVIAKEIFSNRNSMHSAYYEAEKNCNENGHGTSVYH